MNILGAGSGAFASATVAASGSVTAVTIDPLGGGSGYTAPTVSFTGGGGTGTLIQVGNPLIDRTYATDAPPEPMPRPVFVVIPTPLPAGTLTDFLSWNQATAASGPPSAGETFFAYVLRPTTPGVYSVVYVSPLQTVLPPADLAVSELATYNVGSVAGPGQRCHRLLRRGHPPRRRLGDPRSGELSRADCSFYGG